MEEVWGQTGDACVPNPLLEVAVRVLSSCHLAELQFRRQLVRHLVIIFYKSQIMSLSVAYFFQCLF